MKYSITMVQICINLVSLKNVAKRLTAYTTPYVASPEIKHKSKLLEDGQLGESILFYK